jgi:hypothetical protein
VSGRSHDSRTRPPRYSHSSSSNVPLSISTRSNTPMCGTLSRTPVYRSHSVTHPARNQRVPRQDGLRTIPQGEGQCAGVDEPKRSDIGSISSFEDLSLQKDPVTQPCLQQSLHADLDDSLSDTTPSTPVDYCLLGKKQR